MTPPVELPQKDLCGLVNASGFQFQLAVENHVKSIPGWQVAVTEHAWTNRKGTSTGFIDAIVENAAEVVRLVVECKRVREGRWVFLAPENSQHVETFWTAVGPGWLRSGTGGLFFDPESPQSAYCVVRGTGEGQQPMLERLASGLLDATKAVAKEQLQIDSADRSRTLPRFRFYVPVVITNAELFVCHFDPASVNLTTGDLPDTAAFSQVECVRFFKNLTNSATDGNHRSLRELGAAKNRSVVVLNVRGVAAFLQKLRITGSLPTDLQEVLNK